jgi:hypothetical protein
MDVYELVPSINVNGVNTTNNINTNWILSPND